MVKQIVNRRSLTEYIINVTESFPRMRTPCGLFAFTVQEGAVSYSSSFDGRSVQPVVIFLLVAGRGTRAERMIEYSNVSSL